MYEDDKEILLRMKDGTWVQRCIEKNSLPLSLIYRILNCWSIAIRWEYSMIQLKILIFSDLIFIVVLFYRFS